MIIQSKNNGIFKILKKRLNKKYRKQDHVFMVEGPLVIVEGMEHFEPLEIAVAESKVYQFQEIIRRISPKNVHVFKDELFYQLTDLESPQGIIAYFPFLNYEVTELKGRYVYCDNLREPGNVGGIIRSADAFGLDGVILSPKCADLYNPKTIRSTMASIFRIPIYTMDVEDLFAQNIPIIVSTVDEAEDLNQIEFSDHQIIVVGNEAHGVRSEIMVAAEKRVKIPIREGVDSLNANVAASILMYEMMK